ncbi:MAG: cadmium-translocating P-type ATPase [Planctomycetes bacterium]|nr:cadmium-translocating P-type ATPase [Planctomycetota bacterium]
MKEPTRRLQFRIRGMDCAEEVAALKREVGPLVGGEQNLSFDLLNGRMTAEVCPEDVSPETICQAVARAGLQAELYQPGEGQAERPSFWQQHGRLIMTAASGVLTAAGFLVHAVRAGGVLSALAGGEAGGTAYPVASIVLYLLAAVCGGWFVAPKAWMAARRLRPDMNLLMTVAVVGAAAIGEWFEAATVVFLFSLALLLESWSVERSRRAIRALMDLSPPLARIVTAEGETEERPVEQVAVGSLVVVRPWEKIPLDGVVTEGATSVNQAPITGESEPVPKQAGDPVYAGTINQQGAFTFRTTRPAHDTTLARIIHMVEEAHSRRAPSEQWVERFARRYTPAMMALAIAIALLPPLWFGGAWGEWFYQGLVILVIACPCALVISTPVSIVAGLASAARAGVLIKGGVYLETPARLKAVAIDKTGTLTFGEPTVQTVVPLNEHTQAELLERAAALESHSNHPLARAILRRAEEVGVTVRPAEQVQAIQGKGARGVIDGRPFWIGSHRLMHEMGQETPAVHQRTLELEDEGHSVVAIGNDQHVCGLITVADGVRPAAAGAVRALKEAGVRHVVMLTGDNEGTAEAVAKAVGVDEVRAELLPEDKVRAVQELVEKHHHVAMVGDGVNDAPAMAAATLGIAMGAVGSDAAIETADIALMTDDLSKLPWLIRHSTRTLRTIRQNITFALAVKALFMALALANLATLWMAIAADMGASLLVIFNSLRLLRAADEPQALTSR